MEISTAPVLCSTASVSRRAIAQRCRLDPGASDLGPIYISNAYREREVGAKAENFLLARFHCARDYNNDFTHSVVSKVA